MKGRIRKDSRSYHYFFVMPASGRKTDVHRTAMALMGISMVREVTITEGVCGFIVRTDPLYEGDAQLNKEITRIVGGNARSAICHCKYVKRERFIY